MLFRIIAFAALALAACTHPDDRITFVTTTQIGAGADPETMSAHMGFDRQELIVAPVNAQDGTMDSLYASIQRKRSIINPQIKQTYATGEAAEIISLPTDAGGTEAAVRRAESAAFSRAALKTPANPNARRVLVFGTSSNVGLKIASTPNSAGTPEVTIGYKRKERASIPMIKSTDGGRFPAVPLFGSLLVNIDPTKTDENGNLTFTAPGTTRAEVHQIIATGRAAVNAARSTEVRNAVEAENAAAARATVGGMDCPSGQVIAPATGLCVVQPVRP